MDHKIPFSKGGTCHPDNIVLACYDCNYRRQTMPYEVFKVLMATDMAHDG